MAASTATALKQLVESASLGLAGYRDAAPKGALPPFVVFTDGITIDPDNNGDGGDENAVDTVVENVQGDLWERYIDDTDPDNIVIAESYTLAADLRRLIHRCVLPNSPWHTYGVRVVTSSRTRDIEANLVRTRYSIDIYRNL